MGVGHTGMQSESGPAIERRKAEARRLRHYGDRRQSTPARLGQRFVGPVLRGYYGICTSGKTNRVTQWQGGM